MSCDNLPTTVEIEQAKKDITDFNTFMTSTSDTFIDSNGVPRSTLDGTIKKIDWSYVGLFADGVTFTDKTDFAVDAVGTQWIYTGSLPFTATAGTVPSEPTYQVVRVSDHNLLSNRNAVGAHDLIYRRIYDNTSSMINEASENISSMIGNVVEVKSYHPLSLFGGGVWKVSTGLVANGTDILQSASDLNIQFELDKSLGYTIDQLGAHRYYQSQTPTLNSKNAIDRAIDLAIENGGGSVVAHGVYLYESNEYKEISDLVSFEGENPQSSRILMKGSGGTYRSGVGNHYFWHSTQRSLILKNIQFSQQDNNYVKHFYSCMGNDDFGQSGIVDNVIFSHNTDCALHVIRGFGWDLRNVSVLGDYIHSHTSQVDVSAEVDNAGIRFWGADGTLFPQSHSFSDNVVMSNVKIRGHKYLLDAYGLIAEIKSSAFEKGWLGIKAVKVDGDVSITKISANKAGGSKCSISIGQGSYFEQCTTHYVTDREISEVDASVLNLTEGGSDIKYAGNDPKAGGPVEDVGFVGISLNNAELRSKRNSIRLYLGDLGGNQPDPNWSLINIFQNNPDKAILRCTPALFTINTPITANDSITLKNANGSATHLSVKTSGSGAGLYSQSNLEFITGASTDGWSIRGNGEFRPTTDGRFNLGNGNYRINSIYLSNNPIVTSDAREKTEVTALTDDELNAAAQISKEIGGYKWLASVSEKGDNARTHIGLTVQRAIEILKSYNLDPLAYGFICFDKWDYEDAVYKDVIDTHAVFDKNGELIKKETYKKEVVSDAVQAGSRYGFRYDQLVMFILAGMEQRLKSSGI